MEIIKKIINKVVEVFNIKFFFGVSSLCCLFLFFIASFKLFCWYSVWLFVSLFACARLISGISRLIGISVVLLFFSFKCLFTYVGIRVATFLYLFWFVGVFVCCISSAFFCCFCISSVSKSLFILL